MSRISLKTRIMAAMAVGPGLVLLAGGAAIHAHWTGQRREAMAVALERETAAIALRLERHGETLRFEGGPPGIRQGEALWVISAAEGAAPLVTLPPPDGAAPAAPALPPAIKEAAPRRLSLSLSGVEWQASAVPAAIRRGETAWLVFARSDAPLEAEAREHALMLSRWGGLVFLLMLLSAYGAVYLGLRPLGPLLGAIAKADPAAPGRGLECPANLPGELEPVRQRVVELLDRAQAAMAREREIGLALAHDLRTPVTALRAALEVARGTDGMPDEAGALLGSCLEEAESLGAACERLLWFERLTRAPGETPRREPVDLAAAVDRAFASVQAAAAARGLRLETSGAACAQADPQLVDLALHNGFENAVRHAPPGGVLRVSLAQSAAAASVSLTNDGCLIGPGEADKVFAAFWRGDAARNETRLGLGGSLIARAAALCRGEARAVVEENRFTLVLRLPPAGAAGRVS